MTLKSFYKIQNKIVDRSWRHPVTDPVLPCWSDEFTCIRGTIKRIDLQEGERQFEIESYENVKKSIERTENAAKIGAIIGIMRGQYGMTGGAKVEPISRKANFVNVQIENEIYRGWVGDCPFQPGDEVIVVAEWQYDHYEIYAIVKPDEQMISICPNCCRGRWAYFFYAFPRTILMLLIAILIDTGIYALYEGLNKVLVLHKYYLNHLSIVSMVFGFIAFIGLYIALKDCFKTKAKIAEQIFKALNWEKVSWIDLRRFTNKKVRKLRRQRKVKIKNDKNQPTIRFFSMRDDNNLFYYKKNE
ncbi:hypothetical protein A9G22_06405 [Gilliamella sp. App2-1]|uniref:putative type VI secretion system effector n=1 Tax=Gilliamella sp. App2-1 TaxID=3120230 RepID=UPI000827A431|nr:putative type VI secretion system effector [Gilliamella apicola]OCG22834.1 hypothetical protein A9G22_06405 [Gilliamella apicola]